MNIKTLLLAAVGLYALYQYEKPKTSALPYPVGDLVEFQGGFYQGYSDGTWVLVS